MTGRLKAVDAMRGVAIAGVVLFHFVWDLEFTGFISGVANHPLWLAFGRSLAGSFMVLVGVSLALASRMPLRPMPYLRRMAKIVVSAAAITIVTYFVFPATFIYFGILHAIAVATLVGTLFLRAPVWACLTAGLVLLLLPSFWRSEFFDPRWLAWIGFSQNVPPSNDFVPVFPWVGLTLLGMAATRLLLRYDMVDALDRFVPPGRFGDALGWMGRSSLMIYLLHQPVMLSVIVPLARVL